MVAGSGGLRHPFDGDDEAGPAMQATMLTRNNGGKPSPSAMMPPAATGGQDLPAGVGRVENREVLGPGLVVGQQLGHQRRVGGVVTAEGHPPINAKPTMPATVAESSGGTADSAARIEATMTKILRRCSRSDSGPAIRLPTMAAAGRSARSSR